LGFVWALVLKLGAPNKRKLKKKIYNISTIELSHSSWTLKSKLDLKPEFVFEDTLDLSKHFGARVRALMLLQPDLLYFCFEKKVRTYFLKSALESSHTQVAQSSPISCTATQKFERIKMGLMLENSR
jgi:hypothetical protein